MVAFFIIQRQLAIGHFLLEAEEDLALLLVEMGHFHVGFNR